MMRTGLFPIACGLIASLFSVAAAAEIYKTVDKKGHTVYTDLPPANTTAQPVELPNLNTVPATQPSQYTAAPPQQPQANVNYQIKIESPANGATLLPNERNFTIKVTLDKPTVEGQSLHYFVDGATVKETLDESYTVVEPARGEHKVNVKVMDKDGNVFGESETVTILVVRPIAKQNAAPLPKK